MGLRLQDTARAAAWPIAIARNDPTRPVVRDRRDLAGRARVAMLSKLPMYRLRSSIFGPKATRIMTIDVEVPAVAMGGFLLIT